MSAKNFWVIEVECRAPSAIGAFAMRPQNVRADTRGEAIKYAAETAGHEWETRGFGKIQGPMTREDQLRLSQPVTVSK